METEHHRGGSGIEDKLLKELKWIDSTDQKVLHCYLEGYAVEKTASMLNLPMGYVRNTCIKIYIDCVRKDIDLPRNIN